VDNESLATSTSPRIRSLDVLRGVGVLGMLVVHIQLFAFPSLARWNPTAYGDLGSLNWWVWLATSVLADGKFISIFAMLLGVSIVMQSGRDGDRPLSAWRAHVRRMAVLLGLGLLHAYFVWYGDMLVPLALCGAVAFPVRRLSPRWLLILGGLVSPPARHCRLRLRGRRHSPDPVALAAGAQWTPQPRSSPSRLPSIGRRWAEQMAHRVPAAIGDTDGILRYHLLWQMTGLLLIGMALFKLGLLSAAWSRAFICDYRGVRVRGRHAADLARPLAEFRDEVGPPGSR
jgi:uncharacterized protein